MPGFGNVLGLDVERFWYCIRMNDGSKHLGIPASPRGPLLLPGKFSLALPAPSEPSALT